MRAAAGDSLHFQGKIVGMHEHAALILEAQQYVVVPLSPSSTSRYVLLLKKSGCAFSISSRRMTE